MTLIYYLGVSLLFTHELDAVLHSEWKLLFVLRSLENELAATLFIALHVPLFFLFFYLGHHPKERVQRGFRLAVSIFLVVHGTLHFLLSDRASYGFHGLLSQALIYGAAVFGVSYLVLALRARD